jgi:aryl carrier-like protein
MKDKNLAEELRLAELKAKEANKIFEDEKKRLNDILDNSKLLRLKKEIVDKKVKDLEDILGIKLNDTNKNKNLLEIGFDSVKLVSKSEKIEKVLELKLSLDCFFILTVNDFFNLTDENGSEYKNVIDKINNIKEETILNNKHMDIKEEVGFCSFMLHFGIISDNEFEDIKDFQLRVLRGELGCQSQRDLELFIKMSKKCTNILKEDEENRECFRNKFVEFKNKIKVNRTIENVHLEWCRLNANTIIYLDPDMESIPETTEEINLIFKYI